MRFPGHETVPIGNRVRVNAALISRSTAVPDTFAGKLINIVSGFENIYQIITYALSSAHEKFGI